MNEQIYDDIFDKLDRIVSNFSEKSKEAVNGIEIEINDLISIYKEMKAYVDMLRKNRGGIKGTTDMYSNLINLKKLILDAKERKYKITENDTKLLKSLYDTISKIKPKDDDSKSGNSVDALVFLSELSNAMSKK